MLHIIEGQHIRVICILKNIQSRKEQKKLSKESNSYTGLYVLLPNRARSL
jgi:hypothetical protein